MITNLHEKVVTLYKDILLCFLKRSYVSQNNIVDVNPMNGQFQLVDSELYLGLNVMLHKDDPEIINENHKRKEFFDR